MRGIWRPAEANSTVTVPTACVNYPTKLTEHLDCPFHYLNWIHFMGLPGAMLEILAVAYPVT
jgi:hypothetical protein